MSSIRWSETRAQCWVSASTWMRFTTVPSTRFSSTQQRWAASMRNMVEHGQISGSSETTVLSGVSSASPWTRGISVPAALTLPGGAGGEGAGALPEEQRGLLAAGLGEPAALEPWVPHPHVVVREAHGDAGVPPE